MVSQEIKLNRQVGSWAVRCPVVCWGKIEDREIGGKSREEGEKEKLAFREEGEIGSKSREEGEIGSESREKGDLPPSNWTRAKTPCNTAKEAS